MDSQHVEARAPALGLPALLPPRESTNQSGEAGLCRLSGHATGLVRTKERHAMPELRELPSLYQQQDGAGGDQAQAHH